MGVVREQANLRVTHFPTPKPHSQLQQGEEKFSSSSSPSSSSRGKRTSLLSSISPAKYNSIDRHAHTHTLSNQQCKSSLTKFVTASYLLSLSLSFSSFFLSSILSLFFTLPLYSFFGFSTLTLPIRRSDIHFEELGQNGPYATSFSLPLSPKFPVTSVSVKCVYHPGHKFYLDITRVSLLFFLQCSNVKLIAIVVFPALFPPPSLSLSPFSIFFIFSSTTSHQVQLA